MKKLLLVTTLAIVSAGMINTNVNAVTKKTTAMVKSERTAAVAQAEKFINEYLKNDYSTFNNWMKEVGTTEKFREEYKKYHKYIEISEGILEAKDGKEVTRGNQALKYLNGYDAEYDPIFMGDVTNLNEKPFKLKSYDEKTGIVILENNREMTGYPKIVENGEERSINVEIPVKVVKQNGKWLVDGAGEVNLK